jgi:hypothetical protein
MKKAIEPGYKPKLKATGGIDTSNFDQVFTDEPVRTLRARRRPHRRAAGRLCDARLGHRGGGQGLGSVRRLHLRAGQASWLNIWACPRVIRAADAAANLSIQDRVALLSAVLGLRRSPAALLVMTTNFTGSPGSGTAWRQ